MFDCAIVGAGPAGSTLARIIGKGRKVLLIDRRNLDKDPVESSRTKPCGGLLAPDAQKMIARLGLGLPAHVIEGPQLFVVRTIDFRSGLERFYQRFYINMNREKFDRWLVSLVPDSVEKRFGHTFRSMEKNGRGVKIRFTCGGRTYEERAEMLIGADGARSLVRRFISGKPKPAAREYFAIQEWFRQDHAQPYFSVIFDREITDFYSWTIPKGNFIIVGSALVPGKGAHGKFEILKERLKHYGYVLEKPYKREGAYLLRPGMFGPINAGMDRVLLIGEAAGLISPSSAEGLSYAFRSAEIASGILGKGIEGSFVKYRRALNPLRANIFLKSLKSPFMYNQILRCLVMLSGIQHIEVDQQNQNFG